MIDEQTLQQAIARIVAAVQPSRVILFGSSGRGDPGPDSDVDLIVIKPRVDNQGEEMIHLAQVVGSLGASVQVLVYSEIHYRTLF